MRPDTVDGVSLHKLTRSMCRVAIAAVVVTLLSSAPALAVNGEILDQQVAGGEGYTVLRVWGSHYDMGYAHAWLLHGQIADLVSESEALLGSNYALARAFVDGATVWKPDAIEDELDGMVAALAVQEPAAGIDAIDLKIVSIYSDLGYMGYACRSHSCWGHLVAAPTKTLSTRRLDFGTPVASVNNHVLCVWLPTDGTPAWANMAWAGYVSVITGVSEFGTIASLHDYGSSSGTPYVPSIPRSVAARHALTMVTDSDPSTHADDVYAELQNYDAGTGSFINYYVPEGYGAVITCRRSPRPTFYKLRKPHASYFDGDVLITTNSETDGSYTPSGGSFMADYYEDLEDANETATQLGHWNVMGDSGLHKMTVNYRDRGDMTVWVDGRLDSGRTPRVELEWTDLDVRKTLTITETNGSWGSVDVEPNQPMYEPNQTITLTAIPIEGKAFSRWEIYDGNYPGDANHAVFDTNDVLVLVMDTDRQVGAAFVCGGSASMLMPLGVVLATLLIVRRRS